MPVHKPDLIRGFWRDYTQVTPGGVIRPSAPVFIPSVGNGESLRHETVWLHSSHPDAQAALAAERQLWKTTAVDEELRKAAFDAKINRDARRAAWLDDPANRAKLAKFYGTADRTSLINHLAFT
jgi:hypothetical protein